ncbi:hypothetical protein QYE76_007363 [Lolium multiflorum]|uniref:Uncharacterized protein n=1 Tax=Lolium multiflorum TaxID=4521 RepID=A0AAD8W523_LOLMU|nr:hypothetical protein QYE76_007363 [Lolium multiflorum]
MAKKWQRMAVIGRKRLTRTTTAPRGAAYDECCTASSVAMEGHCVVYTGDGARFEVPLAYLGTNVFGKLLRMSQEEFGFAGIHDGRITLPCDAAVMDYAMCLLRRDASVKVVKAALLRARLLLLAGGRRARALARPAPGAHACSTHSAIESPEIRSDRRTGVPWRVMGPARDGVARSDPARAVGASAPPSPARPTVGSRFCCLAEDEDSDEKTRETAEEAAWSVLGFEPAVQQIGRLPELSLEESSGGIPRGIPTTARLGKASSSIGVRGRCWHEEGGPPPPNFNEAAVGVARPDSQASWPTVAPSYPRPTHACSPADVRVPRPRCADDDDGDYDDYKADYYRLGTRARGGPSHLGRAARPLSIRSSPPPPEPPPHRPPPRRRRLPPSPCRLAARRAAASPLARSPLPPAPSPRPRQGPAPARACRATAAAPPARRAAPPCPLPAVRLPVPCAVAVRRGRGRAPWPCAVAVRRAPCAVAVRRGRAPWPCAVRRGRAPWPCRCPARAAALPLPCPCRALPCAAVPVPCAVAVPLPLPCRAPWPCRCPAHGHRRL